MVVGVQDIQEPEEREVALCHSVLLEGPNFVVQQVSILGHMAWSWIIGTIYFPYARCSEGGVIKHAILL